MEVLVNVMNLCAIDRIDHYSQSDNVVAAVHTKHTHVTCPLRGSTVIL